MNIKWVMILVFLVVFWHGMAMGQVIVDSAGVVGPDPSITVVNGNPAISYYDATNYDLKYVRATDVDGSSWAAPVTVDSAGRVGWHSSMKVVNGNPAISYYDETNSALKYVRATDVDGSSWAAPVTVDSAGEVGWYTSLIVVNGNPAISYYDETNSALKYVRATDVDGSSWAVPIIVDNAGHVGYNTSMTLVNGNPAISYLDFYGTLNYVRATDVDGSAWVAPITLPINAYIIRADTSITVVNGNPAISSYYFGDQDLKYVRATDVDGSSWAAPVTVDSAGSVGRYTSMTLVNGNPAISYSADDGTNIALKYVQATDVDGSSWAAPVTVDSAGSVGRYTSMTLVNGNPAISYYDNTNGDLKYWRPSSEINLKQGVIDIPDSGNYNFGSQYLGTNTDITFTIENTGAGKLILATPIVIGGADGGQFSIQQEPVSPVAPSGTTTFIIRFSPTSIGPKTAFISIANDDSDEYPYDLNIKGAGVNMPTVPVMNEWGMIILFLLITGMALLAILRKREGCQ